MPTIKDLWDKLTGMEADVTALKSKTPSTDPVALTKEIEARVKLENEFSALKAEMLKAVAGTPPPPKKGDGDEENPHAAAIDALQKAITVLKATSPMPAKDEEKDDDMKAEDASDMTDDEEAKSCATAKDFSKVLAIRSAQFARKSKFVSAQAAKPVAKKAFDEAVKKGVINQIAAMGIPMLTMRNPDEDDLRKQKPATAKEADIHARALVRRGFNEQPAVMALNAQLGRKVS